MNIALFLLQCLAAPGPQAGMDNLDFASGKLTGWEGQGFYLTTATGNGPTLRFGVCSSDNGAPGRTASLRRSLMVPPDGGILRCTAFGQVRVEEVPAGTLDVRVVGTDERIVPKRVFLDRSWVPTQFVLAATKQRPQTYQWDLSSHRGKTVLLVLEDKDSRPGCHLFCSGFDLVPASTFEGQEFGQFMVGLARKHNLAPMSRYDTKHFAAISNADDACNEAYLRYCETIYPAFFEHFRDKGFRLEKPQNKLMVAVFDSQLGFEAYLGRRMPYAITGLYDRQTNRLIVYDVGQNKAFLAQKKASQQAIKGIGGSDLERQRQADALNRLAQDFRADANVVTLLHEVAHQLSFNSGMLNREGDVPLWLGEGLACYCEATDKGAWRGIGEPNPERLVSLRDNLARGELIPLRVLIESDDWVRGQTDTQIILLGYAQSWALFRMMMEEHPKAMRVYMELIQKRKTPDYRTDDFRQAFGNDLDKLQKEHGDYVKRLVKENSPPRR